MGFFRSVGNVGSHVFNFKVHRWFGTEVFFNISRGIGNAASSLVTPEHAERSESFEEALTRLGLTEADLAARKTEFTRLLVFYFILAGALFCYALYIVSRHNNVGGFFMALGITLYCLGQAFRYHFWLFQIRNKKLGCSLREWFNGS